MWDLDGNKFINPVFISMGTKVLSYSLPEVDEAVRKIIDKDNLSTLHAPEEVHLS